MNKHKSWNRYLVEMMGSLILFAVSLFGYFKVDRHMPEGILRTMIRVSPILTFLIVMWVIVRQVQREEVLHQRQIWNRYVGEMLGAFTFYAVALALVHRLGFPMHKGMIRTLVLVSPMVPFLLVLWVVLRQIRRLDEYQRLQTLETIAIAAGVTAGWTFTYGFLENAGFPLHSMFNVMPVMFWVWGGLAIFRTIMGR